MHCNAGSSPEFTTKDTRYAKGTLRIRAFRRPTAQGLRSAYLAAAR